jgi:hypothetical protein
MVFFGEANKNKNKHVSKILENTDQPGASTFQKRRPF